MNELKVFYEIAKNPHSYAENWKKETGKKIVGHFCSYTPEEFVAAADALPFRLFGTTDNITRADAHLQSYSCSLVRGGLEDVLSGKLGFLDGTIFPHTCDSIQRLSDIWRLNSGIKNHFDVILPVKLNTPSSKEYFNDVLIKVKKDIETGLNVEITDEKLTETIKLYNGIRNKLREIYTLRSRFPDIISGYDINAITRASMVMDRNNLLERLTDAAEMLNKKKASTGDSGKKRIVLTGGICNNPDIHHILDELGSVVVWDDLCTGGRYFDGVIPEAGDPVNAITERYIERNVCPAKYMSNTSRGDSVLDMVKEHNAKGVIFMYLKFCDPQGFDYPYMKEMLDKENIPNMLLEIEEHLPAEGQLRTRFETFIEML